MHIYIRTLRLQSVSNILDIQRYTRHHYFLHIGLMTPQKRITPFVRATFYRQLCSDDLLSTMHIVDIIMTIIN